MTIKSSELDKSLLTPVIQQYLEEKSKAGEAILLFRLGDFYEAFFEDGILLARELELTLTARNDKGHPEGKVPMSGIPVKAAENYIGRLLKAGHKVAICEQIGDPSKAAKGPMERKLVRILTPGSIVESEYLSDSGNSWLAAICPGPKKDTWGLAYVDVSTGEILMSELSESDLILELEKVSPNELILPALWSKDTETGLHISKRISPKELDLTQFTITERNSEICFNEHFAVEHFGRPALKGFGCEDKALALRALGSIFEYLDYTCPDSLQVFNQVKYYQKQNYLQIDSYALRNLEIFETARDGQKNGSLYWLISEFISTKMAQRLMKQWLMFPLIDEEIILKRQAAIKTLISRPDLRNVLREAFSRLSDLERLAGKLKHGRLNPRELGHLRNSLNALQELLQVVKLQEHEFLRFDLSEELLGQAEELDRALNDELPIVSSEGNIFRGGYNSQIDEYRETIVNNESWLREYEQSERNRTNIKSLKVAYNKAIGYYIEITKPNAHLAPAEYHIKQNLTNANRYFTPELKEHENTVIAAESSWFGLEGELFGFLRDASASHATEVQSLSHLIAQMDCLLALAEISERYEYVCPIVNQSTSLKVIGGRHPVIERLLPSGQFIANDLELNAGIGQDNAQIMILTGPNMSGKSTYMKQIALIVLLAQIGSYVPAESAEIGIVDKVFTRIGASDNLALGQSTFMVEMLETANLLNNLSERSLLLLDEIGRGTSTYDGVAIAWAVTEHIAGIGARTIFATHYHELNALEGLYPNIKNYQVTVTQNNDELIFLHKVMLGGASESYGLEVAKMAGIPSSVTRRAGQIIRKMNTAELGKKRKALIDESVEQVKLI